MHKPNAVFLPESLPDIDIEGLTLECLPGKIAVLMGPERESVGSILLTDKGQGRYRPDVGRVVSATGPKSRKDGKVSQIGIGRGDYVLVRGYGGAWFNDYWGGKQLRLYGIAKDQDGLPAAIPWDDDILCVWENGEWIPAGGNVMFSRAKRSHSVLAVKESWENYGTVLKGNAEGKTIYFTPEGPDDVVHLEFGDETDVFIVHSSLIEMVTE